ncbi:alpha/beta fold hydrolase [Streptomyces sp. NPDC058653]|uniref:alpha/beta fold hydrolase n=1 Tax=Streptomyces sp. NPDC058653 TaxID=3346576 RepID=UPI003657A6BA
MNSEPNIVMRPQVRTIGGLSVRFAESGKRRGTQPDAVLLSPWPESLFAFNPIWNRLAEHAHLLAIDLPGFGRSERRDELLSPRAMGEFIISVADAFGLENPHLVGPDIGTSASLFAAASQPGRLRSLVVGSGGAAVPLRLESVLKEWVEAPDLEPYRGIDGRHIVGAAMEFTEGYSMPAEIREDYLASYEGERFAESMRYVRRYPQELPILGELLPSIQTPVRIISGSKDVVVPAENPEFLQARLPRSRSDFIDVGHFVWEEAPDGYAALITEWWGGEYRAV